ncbi:hypothetical protein [Azospirillum argentinense]|uniref:hypothetical protein n=1 Tax=Azospirillum argentinense TaxID=2970906 RepID=UPI0032DEA92D
MTIDIELAKFGEFYGSFRTPTDQFRLLHTHIEPAKTPHDLFAQEPALFRSKWFDYRFLTPVMATYLYAEVYRRTYQRLFARHVDRERAKYARGTKFEEIFPDAGGPERKAKRLLPAPPKRATGEKNKPHQLTGYWVGRQVADAIGAPYDVYIELAMEKCLRWQREYLPRPTQLYSDQVINHVTDQWAERCRAKLYVAEDPRYRMERFKGTPDQIAHQTWLMDQLSRRPSGVRAHLLGKYLWDEPLLGVDAVVERFGPAIIQEARDAV